MKYFRWRNKRSAVDFTCCSSGARKIKDSKDSKSEVPGHIKS